ncbi:MAG: ABC transporter ATP-binding protein [Pigmentiphaga sp.]|nr:ABC transporter ATP-binding protein [Pigmentiphaga sp.]
MSASLIAFKPQPEEDASVDPRSGAPMLHVEALRVHYRQRVIVDRLSLPPLRAGEILGLVGPNAAGKSTLLRALAGLVPFEGRIAYGQQAWAELSLTARSRLLGFMPQRLPEDTALTVLESVLVAGQAGSLKRLGEQSALHVLDRLGILDLSMRPLHQLSGGQRQLVALAQVMVRNTPILLLDEPTSALDLAYQWQVLHTVRALAREGRIVVVVLHDLTLAAQWADRVAVMKDGRIEAFGRPEQAIAPDVLTSAYGVRARVRHCDQGRLYVMVDGLAERDNE